MRLLKTPIVGLRPFMKIVIIKPSKYLPDGAVERFRRGFMPNSTIPHLRSMVPSQLNNEQNEIHAIDEYVHTDLKYLKHLQKSGDTKTLVVLVGVQSHQFHRALDLAALAKEGGCMVVIGGPHVMTCDTSMLQGFGVSFAQCEAELVWSDILADAVSGELKPLYGAGLRWQDKLESPVLLPPQRSELSRYIVPMLGVYPARGCPFRCNFCSVIKIAGNKIRSQSIETTLASLRAAKKAGISTIMFTSDNFNKYPQAEDLLRSIIDERLKLKLFVQCDTQVANQASLVELLGKAGCYQIFLGVESFDRKTLVAANKKQNRPQVYRDIVRLCHEHGIGSHFSNIIGFPQDSESSIFEHLESLKAIQPNWASFYILCPIPGTEQYDSFLRDGLITERNLDRFDTSSLTWKHPSLSAPKLSELLYECYRRFMTLKQSVKNVALSRAVYNPFSVGERLGSMAMSAFVRYCAWRKVHPMSGGIMRVKRDYAIEYAKLRTQLYGYDLVPLPRSLPQSVAESPVAIKSFTSTAEKKSETLALN
jgi:hypothetical protein